MRLEICIQKSNNIEIMIGSETDEIIEDLFESFLQKYQEGLEESMRGSQFVYDGVDVLYYNLSKVSLSRCGSYIDYPKWLKNKCFQYALTVALIRTKLKRIRKEYKKLRLLLTNTIART